MTQFTTATDAEIATLISRIAEINGGGHLERPSLPTALVDACCALVVGLGATEAQAFNLTDKELQSFYTVTKRGGAFAGRSLVAKRFKAARPQVFQAIPAASTAALATAPLPDSIVRDLEDIKGDIYGLKTLTRDNEQAFEEVTARIDRLDASLAAMETVRPISITIAELPPVQFNVSHPMLPRLIRELANGEDVWLVGDRGSGKSVAARQAAKALGVDCYIMTGADDKTDIVGYKFNGEIKKTPFRDAWINGGVVLLDEMDTYNPAALIVINDALANLRCTFDDGAFDKHPKCYVIAATNTDGRGPDAMYSARSVIDASTRDRFCYIPWGYVPEMETQLGAANPAWTSYVQAVRKAMADMSIPETPSPRATIKGGLCINRGGTWAEAAESYIFKGMAADYQRRVNSAVIMSEYMANCPVTIL